MKVLKRSGVLEPVAFDKIQARLGKLCLIAPEIEVDVSKITASVCSGIHDGISTVRLDELTADVSQSLATNHPDYGVLASRILVSNLHKNTSSDILETFDRMKNVLSPSFLATVAAHTQFFQDLVNYDHDYDFDFFGLKTMERMYLTKINDEIVERPQHMFLRVAIGIWGDDLPHVSETYTMLSRKQFTHASPTLFNAGTNNAAMNSCYLLGIEGDSVESIFDAYKKCALVSKFGGGIGLHVSGVRSKGAAIRGTNGTSDGLVPMLRVANTVAAYINQGNRRKGSIAVYLEPHHPDIFDFLDLKRNSGDDHLRARDLFYAVWLSDVFMERVETDSMWSLFDPSECPGLDAVHGDAYRTLYETYETEKKYTRQVKAQEVWFAILRSQIETGVPYILFKDSANAKSNQSNLGTIKGSNLCCEIIEFTAADEVAVCTLGSISLPAFVSDGVFDFMAFMKTTKRLVVNLDKIIDITFYPIEEARRSNLRHRPIGIGVQGLQDVFFKLKMPFDSPEAAALNIQIFEAMYFAALEASCQRAHDLGAYETFKGSPASEGRLQFDLWNVTPSSSFAWDALKRDIQAFGLRNSLLVAPMPTASTAQLLGNTEAFEPITSNIYSRRTLAGEFAVVNEYLVRDLLEMGLWNNDMKSKIISQQGSIAAIESIPPHIRALYKTSWELSMKTLIDMSADRGPFICQSQSLNLFISEPTFKKMSSMHFYSWKRGLKTGAYYLRTKPASNALQVTIDPCISCSG